MARDLTQSPEKAATARLERRLLLGGLLLVIGLTAAFLAFEPFRELLLAASEKLYEAMLAVAVACRLR